MDGLLRLGFATAMVGTGCRIKRMDQEFPQNERKALTLGLVAVGCWSTVATAFKLALSDMNPESLLFWATLTSTIMIGVVLLIKGSLWSALILLPRDWRKSLSLGLLNPLAYYYVLFAAYDRLPAQVAQPVNYTWAIVLAWLAVPVLGHKLRRQDILAMLLGYAGVVVIALGGGIGEQPLSLVGIGLALSSTIIWAGYWIMNSKDQRDPVVGLFQNFLVAMPFATLLAWPLSVKLPDVLSAIYVGLFEMGVTFMLWLYALKYTRHTSRISNLIFISPFLSLIFIYFILGEPIRLYTLGGLLLIVLGLRVQNIKSS
jgi:drug/metabolite transporter (DMT)-like permease